MNEMPEDTNVGIQVSSVNYQIILERVKQKWKETG